MTCKVKNRRVLVIFAAEPLRSSQRFADGGGTGTVHAVSNPSPDPTYVVSKSAMQATALLAACKVMDAASPRVRFTSQPPISPSAK